MVQLEHLQIMLNTRGNELFSTEDYKQFLRNLGYLHQYSLANQILILLQAYKASELRGFRRLGLSDSVNSDVFSDKAIYLMYPIYKTNYYFSKTHNPIKSDDLTQNELELSLRLGTIYKKQSLGTYRVLRMYRVEDFEQANHITNLEIKIREHDISKIISILSKFVSGGIRITDDGIPIELKSIYNKDKDSISIRSSIVEKERLKLVIQETTRSVLNRIKADGSLYTGAFNGWTIDGTEMISLPGSTSESIVKSATYSILSRIGLDIDEYNFDFIHNWGETVKDSDAGSKYIKSLLNHTILIVDKVMSLIESIFNIKLTDELALEAQSERVEELLSTVEANILRYQMGLD